jgi:hypothetical protein
MIKRNRSYDQGVGCALILALVVVSVVVKFIIENAVVFVIGGCLVLLSIAILVFKKAEEISIWHDQRQRNNNAMRRNRPALRLLLVLAYDNGILSKAEIEVIIQYMSTVHGFQNTKDFRKSLKQNQPFPSERQLLIGKVLQDLDAEELERLSDTVLIMRDAHKKRTVDEKKRFDDTVVKLGGVLPSQPIATQPPVQTLNPFDIRPL